MASRGFEFAYQLDGSNATPLIRDFILSTAAAHKVGDLMGMETDGDITAVTTSTGEVTCIMQEAVASADVTAGTTTAKAAIITSQQVWRCSMDASSTALVVGYTKTADTVDANTLDADASTGSGLILVDVSNTDDESNVLAHVVFGDTTFGNM